MPRFDADQYADALAPPICKVGGREYVGRFVSFEEWLILWGYLQPMNERAKQGDYTAARRVATLLFDAMFPRSKWWRFGERRVSALMLAQPPAVWQAAVAGFIASQAAFLTLTTLPRNQAPASKAEGQSRADTSSPVFSEPSDGTPTPASAGDDSRTAPVTE